MKVNFASCAALPEGDGDDAPVLPALAELGIDARWAPWTDPDSGSADLVVMRATWDYTERVDEFLRWCESVPRLANPAKIVRWNVDKRYLADLAADGVAVVHTEIVPPGAEPEWPEGEFVVKPSVGAGSRGARRFSAGERAEAEAHLRGLHEAGYTALLQPYQSTVDEMGETALVYLGGTYSHAFNKGAMLTGAALSSSGLFVEEELGHADPDADLRALAEDTLDTTARRFAMDRAELLYARVDVVRADDGSPAVLELELVEPSLGFTYADADAPKRFAEAVARLLKSF